MKNYEKLRKTERICKKLSLIKNEKKRMRENGRKKERIRKIESGK